MKSPAPIPPGVRPDSLRASRGDAPVSVSAAAFPNLPEDGRGPYPFEDSGSVTLMKNLPQVFAEMDLEQLRKEWFTWVMNAATCKFTLADLARALNAVRGKVEVSVKPPELKLVDPGFPLPIQKIEAKPIPNDRQPAPVVVTKVRKPRRQWSDDNIIQIILDELLERSLSSATIAQYHGACKKRVEAWLKAHPLYVHPFDAGRGIRWRITAEGRAFAQQWVMLQKNLNYQPIESDVRPNRLQAILDKVAHGVA